MATVTVASKLPWGYYARVEDTTVHFNGANHESSIAGYGMTRGVDAAFFEAWKAANTALPAATNGTIFAMNKDDSAQAQAREISSDVKTGLEGIDPDNPGPGLTPADKA